MAIPSKISGVNLTDFLGQLLVVWVYYILNVVTQLELIPDPIFSKLASVRQSEIGSGISLSRQK